MDTVAVLEPIAFVGIDWASEEHAVCVLGVDGRKSSSFTAAHSRDGFERLVRRLAGLAAAQVPVAIERPDGRLVDALLEAGHPVVPVSPNAIKAWRESEVLSGAKDDPGDAEVIAEYLRLRAHKLSVLAPFSAETRALRVCGACPRRPGRAARRRPQPARGLPGRLLARCQGGVRRCVQRDRPGFLGALPDARLGPGAGRQAHGRLLDQARLLRPPASRRAARAAARCP